MEFRDRPFDFHNSDTEARFEKKKKVGTNEVVQDINPVHAMLASHMDVSSNPCFSTSTLPS